MPDQGIPAVAGLDRAAVDFPATVRVRRLYMRYGDKDVIDGLDLTIRSGEFFALLGPSCFAVMRRLRRRPGRSRVLGRGLADLG
jgi:hypothetical protein